MSYPIELPKDIERGLRHTSSKDLAELRRKLVLDATQSDEPEGAVAAAALIDYELQLREVEPLSRKIARGVGRAVDYCKENPEKVADGVASAALVAIAVSLGIDATKRS